MSTVYRDMKQSYPFLFQGFVVVVVVVEVPLELLGSDVCAEAGVGAGT